MVLVVSRDDVIAFRLHAHHLTARSDTQDLLEVAGRCGVQNSPPGSALLALHARVQGITGKRVDKLVAEDRSLLQSWCMRGAPFYFPTSDAAVFTSGVLPPTEQAMRQFVLGVGPALDRLGLRLAETVEWIGAEIGDVLSGRRLAINELGVELTKRITPKLVKKQRDIWNSEGPYAVGQSLGEAVVHFCVRILTLRGIVCLAPRDTSRAPFVLVDEWLGEPIPSIDPKVARAELLRRYLRSYGPSTRADFAAWVGVRASDADPWWSLVVDEMTPVEFNRRTWMLSDDVDTLQSLSRPTGVRLLPPRDPYTQLRDRETLVDKRYHRDVWRPVGDPGTILVDGQIVGTWRPRKSGRSLTISIKTFDSLPAAKRKSLQGEAAQIAPLRGASSVDVAFDTY